MKVLVLGAAGKTGSLVVERALAKGHEVTVLVRDASKLKKQGVRVLVGDPTKPDDVLKAVRGQDAVIETIGGTTPYRTTRLESTSARNIIGAMHAEGIRRLIVISMMGLGESRAQAPFWDNVDHGLVFSQQNALREIIEEACFDGRRKLTVEDGKVHLIVQCKGAVVDFVVTFAEPRRELSRVFLEENNYGRNRCDREG
jgi:NADPH:quinone reductase-like Zn-dependent oxidoreductase